MEQTDNLPVIRLTQAAAARFKVLLQKNPQAVGVWLTLTTKGCNGKSYKLDYVNRIPEGALPHTEHGVHIFVDGAAADAIRGTVVDYVEDELYAGFEFNNPNEKGRCGCGASFNTDV